MLSHHTSRCIKEGIVQIVGDFNARIQARADDSEIAIGPHTFRKDDTRLHGQSPEAADSRQRFLAYCHAHGLKIMNTFFQKSDHQLATYAEPGSKGPPYDRKRYETLDYVLTTGKTTYKT